MVNINRIMENIDRAKVKERIRKFEERKGKVVKGKTEKALEGEFTELDEAEFLMKFCPGAANPPLIYKDGKFLRI